MKTKLPKRKLKVGIIGTGNIGSDLLVKVQRSELLECSIFTGKNSQSEGIKRAKAMGIKTSYDSIQVIEQNPDICEIIFDATSVESHLKHAPILKKLGIFTIDMTPSRAGKMCVPLINLAECLEENNINMVTCGGQAVTPLVFAMKKVHPEMQYVEVVSSISSKSAGMGTRENIDEYTQTTSDSLIELANVPKAKAIIILNPAEPPILMHNTVYALIKNPKIDQLSREIILMVEKVKKYIPGYKLLLGPVIENNRVTLMVEVVGRGDFLPIYAGNLDTINCAAIEVAEEYARRKL